MSKTNCPNCEGKLERGTVLVNLPHYNWVGRDNISTALLPCTKCVECGHSAIDKSLINLKK